MLDKMLATILVGLTGTLVVALGWCLFWLVPTQLGAERECLRLGYAESSTDYTGDSYCILRDYNGKMRAIPLEEARQERN